jgi:hypothetical protein
VAGSRSHRAGPRLGSRVRERTLCALADGVVHGSSAFVQLFSSAGAAIRRGDADSAERAGHCVRGRCLRGASPAAYRIERQCARAGSAAATSTGRQTARRGAVQAREDRRQVWGVALFLPVRELPLTRIRERLHTRAFVFLILASRAAGAADPNLAECLTANEDAIALRLDHKLLASRDESLVCSRPSCPAEVREACQARLGQLNAAIPTVVFEAKDATGNDLGNVAVTMDGHPFAARLDGTAVPLDPGDHTFEFVSPGRPPRTKSLVVYQGETNRRERIELDGPARVTTLSTLPGGSSEIPMPSRSGVGSQRIVGLGIGGVGIAGVAVGSVFGLLARSAWSSVTTLCGPGGPSHCASSNHALVLSDHGTAVNDGTASTVAFIAGGALLAGGVVVVLTGGPRRSSAASTMTVTSEIGWGSFSIRGDF